MSRMSRLTLWALSAPCLSGCALFDALHRYESISEPPPKGGLLEPMRPRASTIQPALNIPIAGLQAAANAAANKVLPVSESRSQRIASIELRDPIFNTCILCESLDVHWGYTAALAGPITVSGGNDRLAVTLPARVDAHFGFGGELARIFALDRKNAAVAAEVSFASALRADSRYCPALVDTAINYRWLQGPELEIIGENCFLGACIGPWRYNFASYVDPTIRPGIAPAIAELQNRIPCEPVRHALQKIWKNFSFPVAVPYVERMYLNITPKALYFPGLGVTPRELVLAGRFDALVSLDTAPGSDEALPLPVNAPLPISPGKFSLAVPVSSKYYTFEALAKQEVVGKSFAAQTPLGEVVLRPKKVEIYPSGEHIALGVSFILDSDWSIFDTSGTVWFSAKPSAIDGGRKIRLSEITVTRKFSSPIWNLASVLLQERLAAAVATGFELDLSQPIGAAEAQLSAILGQAGQGSGIVFNARDVALRVDRILTNDQLFQVEVVLDATVDAQLGTINLGLKE